jgi:hypothetical protein
MRRRRFVELALLAPTASRAAENLNARSTIRVPAWLSGGAPGEAAKWNAAVEGKQAKVLRAQGPADPLLLLLVLDLTGDITQIDPARQSVIAEIQKLPEKAWVTVLRAQDGLLVLSDPSADRAPAVEAVKNLQISGRAGLLDTVEQACRLASSVARKSPVRTAVFYVTDSDINNYREDYTNPVINYSDSRDLSRRFPEALVREKASKLSAALAPLDAPLFIVHLLYLRDRLNEAYQTGLQQIASSTGGSAALCRTLADIPVEVNSQFSKITNLWAVDLELPAGVPKNFSIQLNCGDLPVQYRDKYTRASQ